MTVPVRHDAGHHPSSKPPAAASSVDLDMPIQYVKGVGPKRAELLQRLGISTLEDALYYLPRRYEDRSNLKKLSQVVYDRFETVSGVIKGTQLTVTPRRRMKILEAVLGDGTGFVTLKWFNQPYLQQTIKPGTRLVVSGMVRRNSYHGSSAEMDNPEYEIMEEGEEELIHTGRIVPVYGVTAGLSVRQMRVIMKRLVEHHAPHVLDCLPESLRRRHALTLLPAALSDAHFPPNGASVIELNHGQSSAHRRLVYEELFLFQLGLALRKQGVTETEKGIVFMSTGELTGRMRERLPFRLTTAQERVIGEIMNDMKKPSPMNRLVQGDVGCGKTVVALHAMLAAVESGWQAALMAPTEILAEQHFLNIHRLVEDLGIKTALLTSSLKGKERKEVLAAIADGSCRLVIGTHAVIQQEVIFHGLGLAVIDEQHRFGVYQRAQLRDKGGAGTEEPGLSPDLLVMTATPIPRTLALTLYGDLDVSVINQLPPGRQTIETTVLSEKSRDKLYHFVTQELKKGRQAYVICPLIEEDKGDSEDGTKNKRGSAARELKAVQEMAAALQQGAFSGFRVAMLHGRMKSEEKESTMDAFKKGEIDILVSTTVVEVGVDVPNATVMVVEHAERFGLAQLHQLRGRVGRGAEKSFCLLMTTWPMSDDGRARLEAIKSTKDGFMLAEKDLQIRGPGEFFGARQSGLPDLRVANILRDAPILQQARDDAFELVGNDPGLELPEHRGLRESVARRWRGKMGLVRA